MEFVVLDDNARSSGLWDFWVDWGAGQVEVNDDDPPPVWGCAEKLKVLTSVIVTTVAVVPIEIVVHMALHSMPQAKC